MSARPSRKTQNAPDLEQPQSGGSITAGMAWNLAAPHTWPAAIIPVLIATCIAATRGSLSVGTTITLLLIAILMQSSANTFNDYYDYVKGTDSTDDYVDPSDSVLVYNNVNPRSALVLAIGYLAAAFVLGISIIVRAGVTPLVIALIGAVFVVLYSAGKTPVSYLPIGEITSGFVMGGLILVASYQALTIQFDWLSFVWAIPTIIGVGLIMMTNNTSDIERDIAAGRKTLPVTLGRNRAVPFYRIAVLVWIAAIVIIVAIFFTPGCIVLPFMILAGYPLVNALFNNPLTPERRLQSMPQILSVNIVLGAFYAASILASGFITLAL